MAGEVIDSTHVESADGTSIGFASTGSGPGLVVLPGTLRAARHYRELAAALAIDFTVHTVDRRGRGTSGPQGPGYGIDAECADLAAVLAGTGATMVFGHSFGGLVALEAALRGPDITIDRLAIYEPAISVNGTITTHWVPELDLAIAEGRVTDAMGSLIAGLELAGPLGHVPERLRAVLGRIALRGHLREDMELLLPTVHAEVVAVTSLDSDGGRYAGIGTDTLLLNGARGPDYLRDVVDMLHAVMPNSRRGTVAKAGHNGPDLEAPQAIAEHLRAYLAR
ncbi:MAG TPA: alpha/beta hydrolase [Pseudonocardiaceae bacterium]|nr:alpha/beta hydrolase [Pseudonocardiaceae bacterium]